ncbi:MAG TPA: DUF4383 domain-containing protein [Oligoflexus sp.]|uniref:DUF4383 domain-containing protein n=1 Tax=Oligoflexus sp. TaxID=1971216 RepID=UPI002D54F81E|nr:DUF4383 domain-containing protein [Oligoflexus sp.]HYX34812.1 DUF4383 domain-containing protein [Oligoflexus sp.]
MQTKNFALVAGILFLVIGVLGFVPAFRMMPPGHAPNLALEGSYGYLFGLFPINVLHNIVHIAVGIWGLMAYRNFASARGYSKSLAVGYGVLAVMGLVPGLNVLGGYLPLFGHDVWLHALTAAVAAYFGFANRASTDTIHGQTPTVHG